MQFDIAFLFGCLGVLLIGLVIGYFITNWYHKVNKRVSIAQAQLYIQCKMAEQSGVSQEEIYKAIGHAQGHDMLKDEFAK